MGNSPETNPSPPWVPIVGCIFIGLAVLFFMGLVVASIAGYQVPDNARWLTCIVLALTASTGSGFLGGSAAASGQIGVSKLSPISFGVTGGIAVFVVTLILCHYLYNPPSLPPPGPRAPEITKITDPRTAGDRLNVKVELSLVNLPLEDQLYAAVATDKEFKNSDSKEELVNECRGKSSCVISFSKPQGLELWLRFVVKTSDGQVTAVSHPQFFNVPK